MYEGVQRLEFSENFLAPLLPASTFEELYTAFDDGLFKKLFALII